MQENVSLTMLWERSIPGRLLYKCENIRRAPSFDII